MESNTGVVHSSRLSANSLQTKEMTTPRYLALACIVSLTAWIPASPAAGQAPPLPFRIKPDGSVDQRDLLKLTKRPTASDRITDAELEAIKSKHEIEYGPGFTPTEKPEMPPRGDLYASSVLLSDGSEHTLLPKKAVIWVPESLQSHIVEKPVGKLVLWPDFLKKNKKWLMPHEITFEMAKGEVPLSEEQLKMVRQPSAIVVSVMQGHPISLLGPKISAEPSFTGKPADPKAPELVGLTGEKMPTDELVDGGNATNAAEPTPKAPSTRASRFDFSKRFKQRAAK